MKNLKVVDFIKEHGIEKLNTKYGITVKNYPEHGLYVLNYCQIESPKMSPITRECRGLTLTHDLDVVARSFDRFFNVGEGDSVNFDIQPNDVCYDKIDGSLIRVFFFNGKWHCATRGTAFAESNCMWGPTFEELVLKVYDDHAATEFDDVVPLGVLDENVTYSLELTCVENRVVTRYEGYTLHFLAARHKDGHYVQVSDETLGAMRWVRPKAYTFDSVEHCVEAARNLPDLKEGYVIYRDGVPMCKVKSPTYVAVHLIRGEGLNKKRAMTLALINEADEYLSYFPEDRVILDPFIEACRLMKEDFARVWEATKGIVDQKDFALAVKDERCSAIMFQARNRRSTPEEQFMNADERQRLKLFAGYCKELNIEEKG